MRGCPGLIEAFRQTGTAAVIDREIQLKSDARSTPRAAPDDLIVA
jgi:hypothetical protein